MQVIHGVLVRVAGTGVLIIGESGIGKSALALALVSSGHQLVADDVIEVFQNGDSLTGSPPARYAGMLEVRGLGVLDVRKLYERDSFLSSSSIDICVELRSVGIHGETEEYPLLDAKIPRFSIASADNVNRRLFVETAVRIFRDPAIKCEIEQLTS
jgi:HPr kinase/phosphorylase